MSRTITEADLATLIPLQGLREALREALLPYTRLRELKGDETLQLNAGAQAAWIIRGAAEVRDGDGNTRLQQASITTHLPIAQADGGILDVTTAASATLIVMDRRRLDTILTWTELYPDGERPDSWLFPVLRSELLTRLPAANVQNLLRAAQACNIAPGQNIINQGDPGADYFLLLSGGCEVLRESSSGLPLLIAELEPGDSFGEEALLTGGVRNASVSAGDEGATVLVITKAAFEHLIHQPLLRILSAKEVMAPSDAIVIDVRSAEEFAQAPQAGARNVPLTDIRDAMASLSRTRLLAVTCDTGHRATAAAFLLVEAGFDVGVLRPQGATGDVVDDIIFDTEEDNDLQSVLDETHVAFDDALGEAAELEVQAGPEADDPKLSERLQSAKADLDELQQLRVSLELKLRDEDSERDRVAARLRAERDALAQETQQSIATERGRLEELYALAETRVQELESTRLKLRIEAERDRAKIDAKLTESEQRLTDEAASVRREFVAEQTRSENRERQLLEEKAAREAALVAECEAELKQSRQRLEASLAQSVNDLDEAKNRLAAIERERERAAERARQSTARLEERRAERRAAKAQSAADLKTASAQQLAATTATEEVLRLEREQALAEALRAQSDADAVTSEQAQQIEEMGQRQQRARDSAVQEEQVDSDLMSDVRDQLAAPADTDAHPAPGGGDADRPSTQEALSRARAHLERLRAQSSRKDEDGETNMDND